MMSSAPERLEAEFRLLEAAPPRFSRLRQEPAATEGRRRTYLNVRWASLRDVAYGHQFEESESESESESEEEGEEEEEEVLEEEEPEEEPGGIFTHCELFRPKVIYVSCGARLLAPYQILTRMMENPGFAGTGARPVAGAGRRDGGRH